jgi:choline kinase
MKILTLAAGRGSRLKHQTELKPKCMTEVHNKPILFWQQQAQKLAGVTTKAAVLGYNAKLIESYFDEVFINENWQNSNMVSSLLKASHFFESEAVILSYSDIVYHPSDLMSLAKADGDIVVAYDPNWLTQWSLRFEDPLSDAETFKLSAKNLITEIGKTPLSLNDIEGQFLGLIKITPLGWKKIKSHLSLFTNEEIARFDMTSLLQSLIDSNVNINSYSISHEWFEIDSLTDLSVANSLSTLFNWGIESE